MLLVLARVVIYTFLLLSAWGFYYISICVDDKKNHPGRWAFMQGFALSLIIIATIMAQAAY